MSHEDSHFLDVHDFEVARSLHRIVRAMHDGECPSCHWLFEASTMRGRRITDPDPCITLVEGDTVPVKMDLVCPSCKFTITDEEAKVALDLFGPVMEKNLEVFETWRRERFPRG